MVEVRGEGLSKGWRITGSTVKEVDLANAQTSLQNLADAGLAQNKRKPLPVSWGSKSMSNQQAITLDLGMLKDLPNPIPSQAMDAITGHAIHEETHVVADYGPIEANCILEAVTRLGEEVFVDRASEHYFGPVAREYVRRARDYTLEQGTEEEKLKPVTSAFDAWLKEAVYNYPPGSYPSALSATDTICLQILTGLSKSLVTKPLDQLQAPQRRDLYHKVATILTKLLDQAEDTRVDSVRDAEATKSTPKPTGKSLVDGKQRRPTSKSKPSKEVQEETERLQTLIGESTTPLTERLAEALGAAKEPHETKVKTAEEELLIGKLATAISDHIEAQTKDLQGEVAQLLEEAELRNENRVAVLYKKPVKDAVRDSSWDKKLFTKLQWIRNLKNLVSQQTLRAESYGSLDATRLYRGAIDGLAFKQRRKISVAKTDITCLLDASGSMHSNKHIYICANTLHRVLPETQILSYASTGDTCFLNLHTQGRNLPTVVEPSGGTPSGRALLGTAIKHPKGLIVHFTDGGSNDDLSTKEACRVLAKTHPKLKVLDICLGHGGAVSFGPNHNRVYIREVEDFGTVLLEGVQKFYQV